MCLFSHKKEKRQHKRKPPKNYILRLFFSRPLAENPLHFKTRDGKIFLKYIVPRISHSVLQGRNINSVLAGHPPAFALSARNINSVLAGHPPAFALSARNINSDTREGQSGNVSEQAEGSMAALTAELAVP